MLTGVLSCYLVPLSAAQPLSVQVDSYEIIGENPLGQTQTETLLRAYTGQKTLDELQNAAKALQDELHKAGYSFYQVSLAPQTLDSHKVQLSIKALTVNKISVVQVNPENEFFSVSNFKSSVPSLLQEDSPNLHLLAQQLKLANLNNAKNTRIQFSASGQSDQIDADITVDTRNPQNLFAWLNNTGSEETGDYRLGVGYQHHNLFDRDHALSLSFTTSPDHYHEVKQYGASYRVPLYQNSAIWHLFAYYSDVDSGVVAGGFNVAGKGRFVGTQYEWHLPRIEGVNKYGHHITFGLEDKLFDNDVRFSNIALGTDVRSTPLSIAYYGQWQDLSYQFDYHLSYASNTRIGSHNDTRSYASNRHNADPGWDLFKLGFSYNRLTNGYRFVASVDGQYSNQELISGEQFGVGGLTGAVRGFKEREISGDKGIKTSFELWTPPVFDNQINFMAFADIAYVKQIKPLPDEFDSDRIASIGIGASWRWQRSVDLSVYLAHVIDGNDSIVTDNPTDTGDNKVQFNLYLNY